MKNTALLHPNGDVRLLGFLQFLSTHKLLFFLMFAILVNSNGFSQEEVVVPHKNSGFIDLNGYYDTRDFSVLTINLLASLPHRFQYFSLTNYTNNQDSPDLEGFYAEHNLRWAINDKLPLDLTYQYALHQGEKNDDHRFGFRWRLHNTGFLSKIFSKMNMVYTFNPMFIQFRSKTEVEYILL